MKNLNPLLIKRLFLISFLSFGILLFLVFNGYKYFDLDKLNLAYIKASAYVDKHIILACFSYACIYILTVFFSVPVKPFLKILAGLLFGLSLGFMVCLFAATIGAMLAFLFIKYNWGETSTNPKYKIVFKFKSLVEKHPITILFVSRLLPIPFFIPNILAGILKVKNSIFFFTTLIGMIPVTFIYVWFGVHFKEAVIQGNKENFIDGKFILALAFLGVMALMPLIFRVYKPKNEADAGK
ncbi:MULTISPECIES: TVP38/TMEM64 family protein [Francisella]|uniref:TVP38/TMEM64 family membrane protein n=1 Tax=Francisella opportunistica TaxID=2016517 RepID=A0A345JQR8_9GAMM|nr:MULTISPECIES: VTT domain-containing protein [Francisella]AXH29664.1 DedA family protein [Francisella opportunistica]AXH31314.1 DedA family protein [Francisella opportunistica]AXH32961.1 DedA family protein [Francisella opportunistica]